MPVCKIPKTCNLTSVKWWFSSNRTWQPAHLRRFTNVFSQTVRKLPEQRATEISKSRQHIGLNVKLGLYEVFIKRNNAFPLNCSFFLLIETDYSAKSGLMLIHGNSSLWKQLSSLHSLLKWKVYLVPLWELHLFTFPKAAFVDRYNYCRKDVESLAPTQFSCPLVLISYH